MLDMSVRAKILQLMLDLKRELDLTYLYITHDLATAKFFCDRIAIMYLGRIVEIGPVGGDLRRPQAPVHEGAPARDPRARPAAQRAARPAARRGPRRRAPAARLLVPPAVPDARSRSAAGSRATCATCSRRAGRCRPGASTRPSRRSIGDLARSGRAVDVGVRPAGRGADAAPTSWSFSTRRVRRDPDEPFWRGVRRHRSAKDDRRRDSLARPDRAAPDRRSAASSVECHLYDAEALAEAGSPARRRRRRGSATEPA